MALTSFCSFSCSICYVWSYCCYNIKRFENDIYFQIGLLVLAGLAAKNAILIVEFALQNKKGMNLIDSALEAAKIRLRPIIMTSLAFTLELFLLYLVVVQEQLVDTLLELVLWVV